MPLEAKHGGLNGSSGRPKRVDYGALVLRLIDKSDAGRLSWKPAAEARHFSCALPGDFTLVCRRFEDQAEAQYTLVMTDKGGTELFSITSVEHVSELARLWESSRQIALNLRQKIEKLNDILDRL
jgi:hypothetical protein